MAYIFTNLNQLRVNSSAPQDKNVCIFFVNAIYYHGIFFKIIKFILVLKYLKRYISNKNKFDLYLFVNVIFRGILFLILIIRLQEHVFDI